MSHPKNGRICKLSVVFLSLFFINITAISGFATITISNITAQGNQALQGSTGNVVLKFDLTVSGETADRIVIKNAGPGTLFGSYNINRVAIYTNISPLSGLIGELFPPIGAAESQQIVVNIIAGTSATYYVAYDVSSKANASEVGGSDSYASVELESVRGGTTGTVVPTTSVVNSIKIIASGLSYDKAKVVLLAPPTSVGAGFTNVSIMQLRLRSNNQQVTANSITLRSGDGSTVMGNYAPSSDGVESFVKKLSIYADNGNEYWDGVGGADTLVGSRGLGSGNTQYEAQVTISPTYVNNPFFPIGHTDKQTKMFFVLYDIGTAVSVGSVIRAELADAGGIGSDSPTLSLTGALPTSMNISITVASINLELKSAMINIPTAPPSYYAVAGERAIPMIKFTLDNKTSGTLTNADFIIKNAAATFLASGAGVSKVVLRRSGTLVGAANTFATNTRADITGISIPSGISEYTVEYDISLGATNANINCQLDSVQNSTNIIFGGVVPAPNPLAGFLVTPTILSVTVISENETTVISGRQFPLQIAVRNVYSGSGSVMKINAIRPVFYYQDIKGQDLSAEYSATLLSSEDSVLGISIPPNYYVTADTTITYNFSVIAANLKTSGPVVVDGYVDYVDDSTIGLKPQSIVLSRYRSAGEYVSAVLGGHVGTFVAQGGDSTPEFSLKLPAYIISMNVVPYGIQPVIRFMNGDTIVRNSKLFIQLANNGNFFDVETLVIKQDGGALAKGTDYDVVNGLITVNDLGSADGTLTLDGFSGTSAIETAKIYYYIGSMFKIRDFFAGPSPYKPSEGNLIFSFQLTKEASVKIQVYDSAGQLVWSEKDIKAQEGYNEFSWDGKLDVGGDIGRGIYLVYIVARSTDTDTEKIEKTKFAVY